MRPAPPIHRSAAGQVGPADLQSTRYRRLLTLNFVALLLTAAILGARAGALGEASSSGIAALLLPVLLALFASAWCLFDGRMRHREPMPIALFVIFLFFPVGLPAYCLWSRGPRGLLLGLGILALLVISFTVAELGTTLGLGLPIPD